MTRFIFSLFLLCLLAPVYSATPDITVERAFLYDPESSFDIETAAKASYTPIDKDLSLGFRKGMVWMRLNIKPALTQPKNSAQSDNDRLILRVGPYFMDRIELFELAAGKWTSSLSGDLHPFNIDECIDDLHCFFLKENAAQPFTVYLRLETQGMLVAQTEVIRSGALIQAVSKRIRQISISLTMAVGLFVLGFYQFLKNRSLLLQVYCFFQASIILFLCSTSGLLVHLFPGLSPGTLDALSHILYLIRVFLTILIGWVIILPYQLSKVYQFLIFSLLGLCFMDTGLVLTGHVSLALKLNLLFLMLNPYLQFYGVHQAKGIPKKIQNILLIGYVIYIVVASLGFSIAFGFDTPFQDSTLLRQFADWRLNGFAIGIFIFWVVVSEQASREALKASELIALRLDAAQAKSNEEKLSDRHTLIDILTHELKNPLGTIKFALASLKRNVNNDDDSSRRFKHIDFCVSRMNALIEHVARSSKIDRFESFDEKEEILAADLLNELIDEYPEYGQFELSIQDKVGFNANREMLMVILENLISNAYKYADSAVKIKITVASESTFLSMNHAIGLDKKSINATYFEISNAVGIHAAPEESRLFERYYRHPNAQDISGLGIGLSLVHAASQKIGASVHYLQQDGLVIFTVKVPH